MQNTQLKNIIKQAIDLHVHIGPEVIPRKFTSVKSLIKAEQGKIKGIALKNHFYPTQPFITEIKDTKGMKIIGSVTLNNFIGGLNPSAIYANALLSKLPTIVWLPTINTKQFLRESEFEIPPEWVQRDDFVARKSSQIKPVVINKKINDVLEAVKDNNCILATGHISWQKSMKVVRQAVKIGIGKIIITHPIYQRIAMPIEKQQRLARLGAKIEQCYSMYSIDKIPIEKIAQQIKAVGSKNCIISSDVGQTFSPNPSEALYEFGQLLLAQNISYQELEIMLVQNPNELIQ